MKAEQIKEILLAVIIIGLALIITYQYTIHENSIKECNEYWIQIIEEKEGVKGNLKYNMSDYKVYVPVINISNLSQ